MGADVFLWYARGGSLTQARALRDRLQGEGINVFHDERNIDYGSSFPDVHPPSRPAVTRR